MALSHPGPHAVYIALLAPLVHLNPRHVHTFTTCRPSHVHTLVNVHTLAPCPLHVHALASANHCNVHGPRRKGLLLARWGG